MARTNSLVKKEEFNVETISGEDNADFLQNFLDGLTIQKVNLLDINECKDRVQQYVAKCREDGVPVGNQGLCYHLGLSRVKFERIVDGRYSNKIVSDEVRNFFRQVWQGLAANREAMAAKNKLSAPLAIFWQKNFDKMEDKATVQNIQSDDTNDKMSIEEIQKTLRDNLPDPEGDDL